MKIKTKIVKDGSVKAAKNLRDLQRLSVYVGIPESAAARKVGPITNAELAFIHTNGVRSIDARIKMGAAMINKKISYEAAHALYLQSKGSMTFAVPPRPIIEPAIEAEDNKKAITEELKKAAAAILDGQTQLGRAKLKRAGLEAQNRVRAWFTDPRNKWAPNAPSTIARKGSARPLIDTGELRKSITYVLAEKS